MILETAIATVSTLSYLPCLLVELHLLELGLGFAFRSSSVTGEGFIQERHYTVT